ncbi:TMV resistance protein N-like [Mangifera indica]|uniref:TMV resistance protein N-like n=1 Tax=Mangifera indica TaxID=29780 RepID=UPI001CFADF07|nr:TMV resistance protein N-like [Mangifera indica]XP_044475409.1 TMV resistance protein N-like [Mangifera indica]XP_044475410.1 TMV resistance protein N-like [Mangifera indica]XP_044475412.1 TMV resistance protein N-like [Mangifera indica]XP_044475413.1 TMV resistance protein N-like [Mangifera indica]XP_044475414.1 TMV resistance protein N-like [Mangifera indica]
MSIQRVSSYGSSPSSSWMHDVFISFRGEDTRKNFTDHLYTALTRKGINVFKDDIELEIGKPISSELLNAIEKSRISIVVFSRNYVSSTWCLDELVKIVECKNSLGQMVIPIFYDVDPLVEQEQKGTFEEVFRDQEAFRDNLQQVQKWRSALMEVINLSGWDSKDRYESEFIEEIVTVVSSKLGGSTSTFMNLKKLLVSCLEQLQAQTIRIQWGRSVVSSSPFFFLKFFFFPHLNAVFCFLTFKAVQH